MPEANICWEQAEEKKSIKTNLVKELARSNKEKSLLNFLKDAGDKPVDGLEVTFPSRTVKWFGSMRVVHGWLVKESDETNSLVAFDFFCGLQGIFRIFSIGGLWVKDGDFELKK